MGTVTEACRGPGGWREEGRRGMAFCLLCGLFSGAERQGVLAGIFLEACHWARLALVRQVFSLWLPETDVGLPCAGSVAPAL